MTQISDKIHLTPGEKTHFRVKVIPRQPKTEYIDTLDDGTIRIRLKAVPEKWKANTELIRFLWEELSVPKSSIDIIAGGSDPVKLVRIQKP